MSPGDMGASSSGGGGGKGAFGAPSSYRGFVALSSMCTLSSFEAIFAQSASPKSSAASPSSAS